MERTHLSGPSARRERGVSTLPVIVLLGLLVAGGYNYHRNWQIENSLPRPYAGYSQADLEALLAAYQAENAQAEHRYQNAQKQLGHERHGGMLDQNIAAFEAAQRDSSKAREAGVVLSMQKNATEELEAELARREADADPMKVHLRRLLTI